MKKQPLFFGALVLSACLFSHADHPSGLISDKGIFPQEPSTPKEGAIPLLVDEEDTDSTSSESATTNPTTPKDPNHPSTPQPSMGDSSKRTTPASPEADKEYFPSK